MVDRDDGADVGGMTGKGKTAIMVARENGFDEVIEILETAGVER